MAEFNQYYGPTKILFTCGPRMEGEYDTMARLSFVMFGCSWTEESVLGSQVFGQA